MWIASSLETVKTPTVIALGNFDGVHRGHQTVIATVAPPVVPLVTPPYPPADALPVALPPHRTVVTFSPHPREFFTGQRRQLLTPTAEKAQYLESIGIQQLVLLPFNQALADLTPQSFVEQILVRGLQAQQISVGQDFRFGQNRSGTIADLQQIAAQYAISVIVVPLNQADQQRISSSAIRQSLTEGNLGRANQLLGRAYTLTGQVQPGQQLGRTIGFPTANLKLPEDKFLPRYGVYSVWVHSAAWEGKQPGVMNLGCRPTVNGQQLTVEVHLLDWSGDLYGQTLTVSLEHFLRPEQKFTSLTELKQQIQRDADQARTCLVVPIP